MSGRGEALLGIAASTGALVARAPTAAAMWMLLAAAIAWRLVEGRRVWLAAVAVAVAVIVSGLGAHALTGTGNVPDGPVSGLARLVGDPRPVASGGWRVEVRLDGRRFDAEFGAVHNAVAPLLAGDGIEVEGVLDGSPRRWQHTRHVAGTLRVDRVGPTVPAGTVHGLANSLRRTLARGASPLGRERAALLTELVVGDDRGQSDRTSDDFRAAGLGHLLAAPVAGPLMVWGLTGGLVAGAFGPPLDPIVHLPSGVGLRWVAGVAEWAGRRPLGLLGAPFAMAVPVLVASTAALSHHGRIRAACLLLASTLVALAAVGTVQALCPPPTGIADGIRLLDGGGSVVVVDRQMSPRRLLESLRRRGVHSPVLIVFREPVGPGVSAALVERFGPHRRLGPPGSTDAETPVTGTVMDVGGDRWRIDVGSGLLTIRMLPPGLAPLQGDLSQPSRRVPSAG